MGKVTFPAAGWGGNRRPEPVPEPPRTYTDEEREAIFRRLFGGSPTRKRRPPTPEPRPVNPTDTVESP